MNKRLSFDQLRQANLRRCEAVFHRVEDWSPCDWATALAGECGEACNLIKKYRRLDGADSDKDTVHERARLIDAIGKELADTVIYADLLALRLGLSLGEEIRNKFNEVSERRGSKERL